MKVFSVASFTLLLLVIILAPSSETGFKNSDSSDLWFKKLVQTLPVRRNVSWKKTEKCRCGFSSNKNYTERIVGGVLSKKNAWPWMAAIVYIGDDRPKLLCGASVINRKYLLTAAHCAINIRNQGLSQFRVFLGTNDLKDTNAIIPKISNVIIHPRYDSESKGYDVALLRIEPLMFSSRVSPICIFPQTSAPFRDKEAVVVGWGTTMFGGVPATMQMQTMVNVTSNDICSQKYQKADEPTKIIPMMLCAEAPGSDSCSGDSGGPLFLPRKGRKDIFEQIAITSFGHGCADERFPGVYQRLGKILSWIKMMTRDSTYCT